MMVEVCKWGMYASEYGCTTGFQCVCVCVDTMRNLKMSHCFKAHTFDMPKDKRLIRFVWTSYLFLKKRRRNQAGMEQNEEISRTAMDLLNGMHFGIL